MESITLKSIDNIQNRWGVQAGDYNVISGSTTSMMDFQDVMVRFSKQRAVAVEGEVEPLSTRMQQRNERLDELGKALAELTKVQTSFDSDAEGDDGCSKDVAFSEDTANVLRSLGYGSDGGWQSIGGGKYIINKQTCEGVISRVKSEIDALNNEAQTDMTRLQSLVDRRDESYSTATNLMTSISDTRSNVIRNM